MTEKDCTNNEKLELGVYAKANPLLALVMRANKEADDEPITELQAIVFDKSLEWINAISRLIETASWEGTCESNDVTAICSCSELIRSLSDVSKYIAEVKP